MKRLITFILASLTLLSFTHAQQQQGVWRWVDSQTVVVARLDLASYDHDAVLQWFTTLLKANTDPKTVEFITKQLHSNDILSIPSKLKKAGATELFAVVTLADIPSSYGEILIPLPAGSNPDTIARALFESVGITPAPAPANPQPNDPILRSGPFFPLFAIVIDKTLVVSIGSPDRFQHFTPTDRPDLAKAYAAAGDAPLIVAIAPSDDTRKVIEQMLPQLPPPASVPSTVLTHGFRSANFAATFPPEPKINLVIQSDTPDDAKNLLALINTVLDIPRHDKDFHKNVPGADEIIDAITPKLDADRLTLSLDHASIDHVTSLLAAGLSTARQQATQIQSMSNLKQIGMGLVMYANDHKNVFPSTLDQIKPYLGNVAAQIFTNPAHPDYAYIKPAANANASETMVAYESFDQWPGRVAALFKDGHVELFRSADEFNKAKAK